MDEMLRWFSAAEGVPPVEPDVRWAWLTFALSALVVLAYVAIAATWFLQARLAGPANDRSPLVRLGAIVACCGHPTSSS